MVMMMVMIVEHNTFLFAFALSIVTETFGEWIVINFQLSDLQRNEEKKWCAHARISSGSTDFLILIGSDRDEFRFFEDKRSKGTPTEINDRIRARNVKTRLVFVHRIQDSLKEEHPLPVPTEKDFYRWTTYEAMFIRDVIG